MAGSTAETPKQAVAGTFQIAFLAFMLPLSSRRLHDAGLPGFWAALWLIPFMGWFFICWCALLPSQEHANKYGPAPEALAAMPTALVG